MQKKDVTLYYGLIMAIYSIAYVTMSAFSSVYLLDVGLSNGNVGMLLAVASLLSVLLQPPVGTMIDRNPKISTKGVLLFIGSIVVTVGLIIIFLPIQSITVISLLYGICIMSLMLAQPFLNALAMDAINNGYPMNLGLGRSMGSLGYALGSYAFGFISVAVGPRSIPVAFSVAFLIVCALLYFYPVKVERTAEVTGEKTPSTSKAVGAEVKASEVVETTASEATGDEVAETAAPSEDKSKQDSPWLFLFKYKRFAVMLVGLILVYFSHVLINTFALQVLTTKGGTSADMGTASAIAAVCELVTAVLFSWYMKRVKLQNILRISGIFFTLKILCSLLVPTVGSYYLIQGLQMFGWGFMAIGIVYYVNDLVGEFDKAQGQAYAGMSYTIGSVIGTFLGGNIIDHFGVNNMLLAGTIAAAVGTIVIFFTVEEPKRK